MGDQPVEYPRRKWACKARDEYVDHLIGRLRELEQRTDPTGGPQSAIGKDFAAFQALRTAGELVGALAGWALDHQAGLALKGLEFVPMQPSGTKLHPEFLEKQKQVDDHVHEGTGGEAGVPDPIVARRLLINLVRANPGAFPASLQNMVVEALETLDHGDTLPLLEATKGGNKRSLAARRLELQAIGFVEYRATRGIKKYVALGEVADALGVSSDTIRSWEHRLRREFGNLAVSRTITFARNAASHVEGDWVRRYGPDALRVLAERYHEALRQT